MTLKYELLQTITTHFAWLPLLKLNEYVTYASGVIGVLAIIFPCFCIYAPVIK